MIVKMLQTFNNTAFWTCKHLIDQFRDQIIITELDGKSNTPGNIQIYSWNILHQFYESLKQEDIVSEKFRTIDTAAKLIKNGMKQLRTISSIYSLSDIIGSVEKKHNKSSWKTESFLTECVCW